MKPLRYISTLIHLKPEQIIFQVLKRIHTPKFKLYESQSQICIKQITPPIPKQQSYHDGQFCFLNLNSKFNGWDDNTYGPLWTYNLNYMDWLQQSGISPDECALWIDRFITDSQNNKTGFDPYPTSLRSINWIRFFCNNPDYTTRNRLNHLYSQLVLLSKSTDRNIGGNHLLENAFAMIIGASFFKDKRMADKGRKLLKRELKRQILPDGAHYEQSPMYHCIILDRLLDCINYTFSDSASLLFSDDMHDCLINTAKAMVGHLKNIVWPDGTIPLFNDSAYGIAPLASDLIDYANRLGVDSKPIFMKECGYRCFSDDRINVIADVGNITATNQPGHSHADTFSYEMRIDGRPFIIDTGISTYNKNSRRQYERGTQAHNTVTIDGKDSSKVWSGFRVAGRARVNIEEESDCHIVACHDGFGRKNTHTRSFRLGNNSFSIEDICKTKRNTVSRIHFAPDVNILSADMSQIVTGKATIQIKGADKLNIKDVETSVEYNDTKMSKVAEISFSGRLAYTLNINP